MRKKGGPEFECLCVRLPTITTRYFKRILHDLPLHTLNILVFLSIGFYPVRIIDTENIVLDSGHIDLLLHCKVPCEWIGVWLEN
jgi:hypothetical protein